MIDPQKRMEDVAWCEPSLSACIRHLQIMQERTEHYDRMFRWFPVELCEEWASLDYFFLDRIIAKLQGQASAESPEP